MPYIRHKKHILQNWFMWHKNHRSIINHCRKRSSAHDILIDLSHLWQCVLSFTPIVSSSHEDTTDLQISSSESHLQISPGGSYLQTSFSMATATHTDSTTQISEPLTTKAETSPSTLDGTSSIQTSTHISTGVVCASCKCNVTTDVYWDSYNNTQLVLYKVDKHETSTYKRLHGCATDNRVSAKVMGYISYIVIFSVFLVIVLIDLSRFRKMKLVKILRKIIKKKSVSYPLK